MITDSVLGWIAIVVNFVLTAGGAIGIWRAYVAGKRSGLNAARTQAAETVIELAKNDAAIDQKTSAAKEDLARKQEETLSRRTLEADLKRGPKW